MAVLNIQAATIANGASLSDAVDLGNTPAAALVGIEMPASWTAANLTFQGSCDGTNFKDLYDTAGAEVTVTAAASRYIGLVPSLFSGLRSVKVRSGTSGTPVNQGAARVIKLVSREV